MKLSDINQTVFETLDPAVQNALIQNSGLTSWQIIALVAIVAVVLVFS